MQSASSVAPRFGLPGLAARPHSGHAGRHCAPAPAAAAPRGAFAVFQMTHVARSEPKRCCRCEWLWESLPLCWCLRVCVCVCLCVCVCGILEECVNVDCHMAKQAKVLKKETRDLITQAYLSRASAIEDPEILVAAVVGLFADEDVSRSPFPRTRPLFPCISADEELDIPLYPVVGLPRAC